MKQHETENVDMSYVQYEDLIESTSQNLISKHEEMTDFAKTLPVLAIVREPLVRFVASFKDKIER